jgi:hypothetical protein
MRSSIRERGALQPAVVNQPKIVVIGAGAGIEVAFAIAYDAGCRQRYAGQVEPAARYPRPATRTWHDVH